MHKRKRYFLKKYLFEIPDNLYFGEYIIKLFFS